jgi:FkbM family methyltransferase
MNYITRKILIDDKWWQCKVEEDGGGIQRFLKSKKAIDGRLREPELFYILKREIEPGMTVMDLGANLGYLTMYFAGKVGDKGIVYAVEPDPMNYKLLQDNVELNKISHIVKHSQMGISNANKIIDFYPSTEARNLGSVKKHHKSDGKAIQIKAQTLVEYFKYRKKMPNFIKMDVEGHEVEILDGGYNLFSQQSFPCKIVMELHPTLYYSEKEMERQLRKYLALGFKIKYVVSAGVPIPDRFREWGYTNPVETFRDKRAVFTDFDVEHAIQACCYQNQQWMPGKKRFSPKIARYLMIERD